MPAKDRYHDVVVRALEKDGWSVTDEQLLVVMGERRLWIDIRATKEMEQRAVLVEVKGFENMPSPVDYLADAIGKYVLYQAALNDLADRTPLYMAVPVAAYDGILSERIGQRVLHEAKVRVIVFAPENEEVVQWIP